MQEQYSFQNERKSFSFHKFQQQSQNKQTNAHCKFALTKNGVDPNNKHDRIVEARWYYAVCRLQNPMVLTAPFYDAYNSRYRKTEMMIWKYVLANIWKTKIDTTKGGDRNNLAYP